MHHPAKGRAEIGCFADTHRLVADDKILSDTSLHADYRSNKDTVQCRLFIGKENHNALGSTLAKRRGAKAVLSRPQENTFACIKPIKSLTMFEIGGL